jgi:hypothetical protein
VLDWKKSWRKEEKRQGVAAAIRNLVILGWMKLEFSEALPEPVQRPPRCWCVRGSGILPAARD